MSGEGNNPHGDGPVEQDDLDDLFRGPNDNAYEKEQVRTGPPLQYVAEKFRNSLTGLHDVLRDVRRLGDDDMTFKASYALRSGLVGYLALNNLLALVNEPGFAERIEGFSRNEFREWLDRIDQQGSVTG